MDFSNPLFRIKTEVTSQTNPSDFEKDKQVAKTLTKKVADFIQHDCSYDFKNLSKLSELEAYKWIHTQINSKFFPIIIAADNDTIDETGESQLAVKKDVLTKQTQKTSQIGSLLINLPEDFYTMTIQLWISTTGYKKLNDEISRLEAVKQQ